MVCVLWGLLFGGGVGVGVVLRLGLGRGVGLGAVLLGVLVGGPAVALPMAAPERSRKIRVEGDRLGKKGEGLRETTLRRTQPGVGWRRLCFSGLLWAALAMLQDDIWRSGHGGVGWILWAWMIPREIRTMTWL
jgi:hypothetical protein